SGGTGNISVDKTSLTFNAQLNGSAPATQTVSVTTSSSSPVGYIYQVSTNNSGSWLSASSNGTTLTNGQGLTTPTTLTVSANPSGLTTGQYTGQITLSPNGGSTVTISVTLNVSNNAVTVDKSSLSFGNYTAGGTPPSPQTLQVTL